MPNELRELKINEFKDDKNVQKTKLIHNVKMHKLKMASQKGYVYVCGTTTINNMFKFLDFFFDGTVTAKTPISITANEMKRDFTVASIELGKYKFAGVFHYFGNKPSPSDTTWDKGKSNRKLNSNFRRFILQVE